MPPKKIQQIEENTKHTGHYIITTKINATNSLLCSGCGTPKEQHPVRWLTVDDTNQTDGGAPLQLIPVNDVTVADNVMNAVLAVINGPDEPEQPTDPLAGKYFRLKVKNTTNYMNIANTSDNTGSTSGVTVVAKNESSDTQIFLFEQSGDGYKLKANSGNYIKCHAWNANANATTAGDATELTFESTGNELEYFIKWNNTNMNQGVERDDYFKAENGYVFCDAAIGSATTWVLEEVIPSNEKTLNVTFNNATYTKTDGTGISYNDKQSVNNLTETADILIDPKNSLEVMQILEQINQRGITVIVSTHDFTLVDRFRKRVLTLENGEIIRDIQAGTYGQ